MLWRKNMCNYNGKYLLILTTKYINFIILAICNIRAHLHTLMKLLLFSFWRKQKVIYEKCENILIKLNVFMNNFQGFICIFRVLLFCFISLEKKKLSCKTFCSLSVSSGGMEFCWWNVSRFDLVAHKIFVCFGYRK